LDVALERFGVADPVTVSLDDIRREAGVSVGALYHHFADKAALLEALYLDLSARFQAGFLAELRSHPAAEDGVRAGVQFYLRWVAANRAGATVLLGHRPDSAALRKLNRAFLEEVLAWWRTHVHYGTLRELPLDLIHALWLGPAQEYTRHWITGHTRRPPTSAAEALARAAWDSLKEPR
ncbi:MAG TPA: helix-turn-helix domain-containing protein, partial [Solirubrobacteraceae bacterium]|nr:helix-turn-helix domain-containing protein [Solirubrobacteraceae bacterium]